MNHVRINHLIITLFTGLLLLLPSFVHTDIFLADQASKTNPPPHITFLSEDTINYFSVPENAELTITYQHVWAYGNATFTIYNQTGQRVHEINFEYDESLTAKTVSFETEGTYKLVATGVNYRYELDFSGPSYDWKYVTAALPHKAVFRVHNNEIAQTYLPIKEKTAYIHLSNDYKVPSRDASIRLYDQSNTLRKTVYLDSTDFLETYEQIITIEKDTEDLEFWRIEIQGLDGGQSRVGIWMNESHIEYPTGYCILLPPEPEYYFVPTFQQRKFTFDLKENTHTAHIGSSGYIDIDSAYYPFYASSISELDVQISKFWVSWRWRESQSSVAMNDNADPFTINWDGFNMDPFDQRMKFFTTHQIRPILCLQWDQTAFLNKHPAYWDQHEMDEFAEFCLAMAIHSVAPDIKNPASSRNPFDILGIMPLNEPNLIYNMELGLEESVDAYISLLQTVGQRFRDHPDPRINTMRFFVPGISPNFYVGTELVYWIEEILNRASDLADVIMWDQYQYYLLEDLDSYGKDISRVKQIMQKTGKIRPIGLSEFGIHGGIPTIQEFYGSDFSKLYVFGAMAESINSYMDYLIYFTLIDPNYEARMKGLFTGIESYPPYSSLPPFQEKPQYYALQLVRTICQGSLMTVDHKMSQFDILASILNDTLKIALSNRYEAETVVIIPLDISRDITMYQVNGNGLELINTFNMTTEINITLPPYHLVYLTSKKPAEGSNAEISCTGNLQLRRQRPGSSVSGSFDVSNTGAENTLLSWEIASLPDWGEWQATPSEGFNLSSDDQPVTVIVTGIIPEEENKEYFGHIKIVNRENRSNQCLIPVSVSTPKIPLPPFVDYIQQLLTFFFKNTVLFQLLPLL